MDCYGQICIKMTKMLKPVQKCYFQDIMFLLSWIDFPLVPSARCWKEKYLSSDSDSMFEHFSLLFSDQIKRRQMFDSPTIVALKPAFPTLLLDWNLSTCKPEIYFYKKTKIRLDPDNWHLFCKRICSIDKVALKTIDATMVLDLDLSERLAGSFDPHRYSLLYFATFKY